MAITTEMRNSMHVLYDPDGSEFVFPVGGSVQNYLNKGFLLKPPSAEKAEAVRKAKATRDAEINGIQAAKAMAKAALNASVIKAAAEKKAGK